MLRPKRRCWLMKVHALGYTQPCACCGKPADDPHHPIGHGQGEWVRRMTSLCCLCAESITTSCMRDTVAFEEKYGS